MAWESCLLLVDGTGVMPFIGRWHGSHAFHWYVAWEPCLLLVDLPQQAPVFIQVFFFGGVNLPHLVSNSSLAHVNPLLLTLAFLVFLQAYSSS